MANYIQLTWTNTCDLGGVLYNGSNFVNKMFLDTDVIKPEYANEEVGNENGEGTFVLVKATLKKRYQFEIIAPEYVADALNFMALHDTIEMTFLNGTYACALLNVRVETTWEDFLNDCMATIVVSFEQGDQVIKTGCCDNMT